MPYFDLLAELPDERTSLHYSDQWSADRGMGAFMINSAPQQHTMQFAMGWGDLFNRIRATSEATPTAVFDAACGYGGILHTLFKGRRAPLLEYFGADIREGLQQIPLPETASDEQVTLVRHDISAPLPIGKTFDFVVCRNAIHHTPDPKRTFDGLVSVLKPGATIALSAYCKKALCRETLDDALREKIVAMDNVAAMRVAREFSELGKRLRAVEGTVVIPADMPFLGIRAGEYPVQELIYNHIFKCWYNEDFGLDRSDVVNFDWYHPPFAYRYTLDELKAWFDDRGLKITRTDSHPSQHYVEGVAR